MTFDDLTPQQINQLVHQHIMGEQVACINKVPTRSYRGESFLHWSCATCGASGDDEPGLIFPHVKATIPDYSENMSDAWEALVYRHGRLNYAGDTTRTRLQILLEDRVGADWRDILENMNAYLLCQVMLQAVDAIDAKGNVLVDLDKGV